MVSQQDAADATRPVDARVIAQDAATSLTDRLPYTRPALVQLSLQDTAMNPSGVTPDGPKLS